jgi:hypothetical protein
VKATACSRIVRAAQRAAMIVWPAGQRTHRGQAPNSLGAPARAAHRLKCWTSSARKPRLRSVALKLAPLHGQLDEVAEVLAPAAKLLASLTKFAMTSASAAAEERRLAGLRQVSCLPPRTRARTLPAENHQRTGAACGGSPAEIELYLELEPTLAAGIARALEEAIRTLRDVESANLKGLLRRVIGKIFNDTEIKGWCKEFENKNLAAQTPVPEPESVPA